ncbi:MAG TPA: aminotransferase class V-fold PLP-dependent enzyme [Ginsengibacter sp.]|nr:aminotransferase class V-fold PLP-dependent enzyme [Ginsengibacter sp.]HRP44450.1 aminotransferase class V-fold PLP-dependent enzyme [Ginsengibacter sp.]
MDTQEIIDRLDTLNTLSRELEIGEDDRKKMAQQVTTYTDGFINVLQEARCFTDKEASGLSISGKRHTVEELLSLYQEEVIETGIIAPSGKHFGYIPAGGIYAAALADFLAAVTNPYAGVHYANPGAATIENEVVNWLKKVFGFPENSVGTLTSGGSVSNLVAFTAARDKYKIKNGIIPESVVYLTEQVHHSAQKALRIIGLEDVVIRYIPVDDHFKMKPYDLDAQVKRDIADGLNPFLVVGTAGTTDTGAVDPLNAIADVAEKYDLWYHVDAAYGGFFILTSKKDLFRGIERADSVIVDPHKSMFIPYGLAGVLIKDKHAAFHSNSISGNYMQDAAGEEMAKSPANLSPELTRHFRGLRLWWPLQFHGVEPFSACLEEKLLLVKYFRLRLAALGFELGPEPDLSVSYFRYPFESDAEEKNKQLMAEIHKNGDTYFSSTIIEGRFVIRIAVLSFRSKRETVDRAVAMIERCLALVK